MKTGFSPRPRPLPRRSVCASVRRNSCAGSAAFPEKGTRHGPVFALCPPLRARAHAVPARSARLAVRLGGRRAGATGARGSGSRRRGRSGDRAHQRYGNPGERPRHRRRGRRIEPADDRGSQARLSHQISVRHDPGGAGGRSQESTGPRGFQAPARLFARQAADGNDAAAGRQGIDLRGRAASALRGGHQADGGREGGPRQSHSGRYRGRGEGDPYRAQEGRRLRGDRQAEVEGSGCRQRRRSRLFHPGPDGAGIRPGGVQARSRPALRSGEDPVRLAHHQGRGEARPADSGIRIGAGPTGDFPRPPNPGRPDQQIARAGEHRKGRGRARGRAHSDPRHAEAEIAIVTMASMGKAVSPLKPAHAPRMPEIDGVRLATAAAGIRYAGRTDVLLVALDRPTSVAGVFTPAKLAAKAVGCRPAEVFLASTGVIGEPIDAGKFAGVMHDLAAGAAPDRWVEAAEAIGTTDTFPKLATATARLGGAQVKINGIAKGAGMIAPDMATLLAFVFTDAPIAADALQALIARAVVDSFNAITIDSDTSTSDTLLAFATGAAAAAGAAAIVRANDRRLRPFRLALDQVLGSLAEQVARDGEGASKLIEIVVEGAVSKRSARRIALAIANSPLVKTAVGGGDANWGRVVMAVGKAGEPADRDRLSIWFGDIRVAHKGARDPAYAEREVSTYMQRREIKIRVGLGLGTGRDRVLPAISPRNTWPSTA